MLLILQPPFISNFTTFSQFGTHLTHFGFKWQPIHNLKPPKFTRTNNYNYYLTHSDVLQLCNLPFYKFYSGFNFLILSCESELPMLWPFQQTSLAAWLVDATKFEKGNILFRPTCSSKTSIGPFL